MKHLLVGLLVVGCACSKKSPPAASPGSGSASASGSGSGSASASGSGSASGAGSGSASGSGSGSAPPAYRPAANVPKPIGDAIAAPDRTPEDRALDAGRKPGEVLAFFHVAPGQKLGELFAGGGYTTELLARVVGDAGEVFAQNTKEILDRFARKPWSARAAKAVMKHVVGVERPIDDPFPPGAKNLDAVIFILNYHDTVAMKADRAKLNKAVFAALKPGGVYGIVDHRAKPGSGTADASTLHRIDEDLVKKEVTAAGFKLDGESDVLANPADPHDWNASPKAAGARRGTSDRFVLRFVKPGAAKPAKR